MYHDPARVGLERNSKYLPRPTAGQGSDFTRIDGCRYQSRPRFNGSDAAGKPFFRQLRSRDTVPRMLARVQRLRVCSKHRTCPRCHAGCVPQRCCELIGREPYQLGNARRAAERSR